MSFSLWSAKQSKDAVLLRRFTSAKHQCAGAATPQGLQLSNTQGPILHKLLCQFTNIFPLLYDFTRYDKLSCNVLSGFQPLHTSLVYAGNSQDTACCDIWLTLAKRWLNKEAD